MADIMAKAFKEAGIKFHGPLETYKDEEGNELTISYDDFFEQSLMISIADKDLAAHDRDYFAHTMFIERQDLDKFIKYLKSVIAKMDDPSEKLSKRKFESEDEDEFLSVRFHKDGSI